MRSGGTRRLELNISAYLWHEAHLSCAETGQLMRMLMAEAAGEPPPAPASESVRITWECRRQYSRIKGGLGRAPLPLSVRKFVFERDRKQCVYCGLPLIWGAYQCDHIEPVASGGSDDPSNLAASCRPCNRSKSAKPVEVWRA
jgi:hypothetical protein